MKSQSSLSKREQEVVSLLLEGKSNKLIASALHITLSTVEFHLKNIYGKYNVGSRIELILKLRQSTVADESKVTENSARLKSLWITWVKSLKETISIIGKELKMKTLENENTNNMTFWESIRICFTKYADFTGRASRPEFWWFALFVTLASAGLLYLSENLSNIFIIAILLPFLAVGARRLQDIGKSSWWLLCLLIPIGGIITLGILWAQPANKYSA